MHPIFTALGALSSETYSTLLENTEDIMERLSTNEYVKQHHTHRHFVLLLSLTYQAASSAFYEATPALTASVRRMLWAIFVCLFPPLWSRSDTIMNLQK